MWEQRRAGESAIDILGYGDRVIRRGQRSALLVGYALRLFLAHFSDSNVFAVLPKA
jgi:hypothetical protein